MLALPDFRLEDRFVLREGKVLLTGIQALVRLPMEQHWADERAGLRTGAFISGYPGSPLGGFDLTLERQRHLLDAAHVVHQPGVNEELAAAAVWGSQQGSLVPYRDLDGVVGIWYGKSPGVDRCGDVFKHANFHGAARNGGVLALAGEDPSCKSSTLPNDSQVSLSSSFIPTLAAADGQDCIDLGRHGIELSRYSGLWIGMRVATSVCDGFGTVEVDPERVVVVRPEWELDGRMWRYAQRPHLAPPTTVDQETEILYGRLEAAVRYAHANKLNRISRGAASDWLGIVASGKTYLDVEQALSDLGLDDRLRRQSGIRLLKLGMTWPFDRKTALEFADGLEEILVIEEKRAFVEVFLKDALYPLARRPVVVGKEDEAGNRIIPADNELTADRIASALASRVRRRVEVPFDGTVPPPSPRTLIPVAAGAAETTLEAARTPSFCSGCPHNRSTIAPEGALSGGGVGCHGMVYMEARHKSDTILPLTPMGSEGAPWIGLSPFVTTDHMFQNLGDGTLTHSGSLAIRACVTAGINITYKVLYNAHVSMTGGQEVTGGASVPELTRQFQAEGVRGIIVCTDDIRKYGRRARWAPGVRVWDRSRLLEAERELSQVSGVTALVFDQRCAAESRRLRKRGQLAPAGRRVVINEAVCEGCGDCVTKSNCLSVQPVDTDLGDKTQIHQSTCNHDYTCTEGDCPAFVTVEVAEAATREHVGAARTWPRVPIDLPEPNLPEIPTDGYSIYMMGVGGTGVVTVNQILGTAAHLAGRRVTGLDQTGLSQKGGPVVSHLRIGAETRVAASPIIGSGAADAYLAFDLLVACDPRHLAKARPGVTVATVSTAQVPTLTMLTERSPFPANHRLVRAIEEVTDPERNVFVDALAIAEGIGTDHMAANLVLLGAAWQSGALPFTLEAVETAIRINGAAVDANLSAFAWGRYATIEPETVCALVAKPRVGQVDLRPSAGARRAVERMPAAQRLDGAIREVALLRAAELVDYQDEKLAAAYLHCVAGTRQAEKERCPERTELSDAVCRALFKLLAYKDEYEVARLHRKEQFVTAVRDVFPDAGVRVQLHPPVLRALGLQRKISLGRSARPAFALLERSRRLRGTILDPFGRTRLRREERRLPGEYQELLEQMVAHLDPGSYDQAVELALLPLEIRGYEELKMRRIEEFRTAANRIVDTRPVEELEAFA